MKYVVVLGDGMADWPLESLNGGTPLSCAKTPAMDELAGIAAKRFSAGDVVTVSVEQVSFLKPIPLGAFIDLEAKVEQAGNTSMQIGLEAGMDMRDAAFLEQVSMEEKRPGQVLAARGTFVYVAVDENGKPRKVRKL